MPWSDLDALTPQALNSRTGLVFNVRDPEFGATGDGTTDDTTAINAAITAAAAITPDGATVYFPPGTYITTGITIIDVRVNLFGAGSGRRTGTSVDGITIIKSTTNAVIVKYTIADRANPGVRWPQVRDLVIQGSTTAGTSQHGLQDDCRGILVSDVLITECGGHGLFLTDSVSSYFKTVYCDANNLDGINIDDTTTEPTGAVSNAVFTGGTAIANGRDGMRIVRNGIGTVAIGWVAEQNTGFGINFASTAAVTLTEFCRFFGTWDELNVAGSINFASSTRNNDINFARYSSGDAVHAAGSGPNIVSGDNITVGSVTITSSSVASPSVITATAHGLTTGETIRISGHTGSTPTINGVHPITNTGANTFTIPVNVTVGGTGGSFLSQKFFVSAGAYRIIGPLTGEEIEVRDRRETAYVGLRAAHFAGGDPQLSPATSGVVRVHNNGSINFRNNAGTANVTAINVGTDNRTVIGDATNGDGVVLRGPRNGFFGTAAVLQPAAYTITNGNADRVYDADATSTAELADVLFTLISDLENLGLIAT